MNISAEWNKTTKAMDRLSGNPSYEEPSIDCVYGRWQGRPIIGRGTPINGGVYVGRIENAGEYQWPYKRMQLNLLQRLLKKLLQKKRNS